MRRFFDTNIFVYALDPRDRAKQEIARAIIAEAIEDESLITSTQVLAELYSTAMRRKFATPARALEMVRTWGGHDTVSHTLDLVLRGLELHQQHSLSSWDALIVQAALDAGCEILVTEDMHHGRRFGALEIRNPFIATGAHDSRPPYGKRKGSGRGRPRATSPRSP